MSWLRFCYASASSRRTTQVAGDLLVLAWVVVAVWLAVSVRDRFGTLADRVREADGATSRLSAGLDDAGDFLGGIPLVGDGVRSPLDRAAEASAGVGASALRSAETTDAVGAWLAVAQALVLVVPVLVQYVPSRVRFALTARRTHEVAQSGQPGIDLLGLRALTSLPPHVVAAQVPDAAAGWRRGDGDVVLALARLQLAHAGLDPMGEDLQRDGAR